MNLNWKKPRGFNRQDMLYADRCMLKWQGFLLSDHNEVLDYERSVLDQVTQQEANEASREGWDHQVHDAWARQRRLEITHRTLNGQERVQGVIIALEADHLVFGAERLHIAYENIVDISD